ncbi:MAG: hypothetical protein ACSW8J_07610, partial [bacterium]
NMAWADIHVKLYFGDQGALSAEGSIYTDEDFVEGGIPLSEKYAALYHDHDGAYADISHDHDGDYAALCHDHDSDYAALSHDHDGAYLSLDGGTLTDALNLANGTWNRIGDDAELGDCNVAGCIG